MRDMLKKCSAVWLLFTGFALSTIFIVSGIGYFVISRDYQRFNTEALHLHEEYIASQQQQIKQEVEQATAYIQYSWAKAEERLRENLKDRTNEAFAIATNLYRVNRHRANERETRNIILEALRPIRFDHDLGYCFATGFDGVEILSADRPELEGQSVLDTRDTRGAYVIRDMIELIRREGEGYYQYSWTKPNVQGKDFPKIAYARYFAPFDGFIGTSEYMDDMEQVIQREVLERIGKIRFGKEGYVFVLNYDGVTLMNDMQPELLGKNIWDMTDPNGVKVIQELRRGAEKTGGDFVRYHWNKPSTKEISPKISFVQGFPQWRWMIGAGVYVDDIEPVITAMETTAKRQMQKDLYRLGFALTAILAAALLIGFHLSHYFKRQLVLFFHFFKEAETGGKPIATEQIFLSEFQHLGQSANRMLVERKKAEERLRGSEELYRTLVSLSPDAISMADMNGLLTFTSPKAMQMFGDSPDDEILGRSVLGWVAPDEQEKASADIQHLLTEGKLPATEYTLLKKDGTRFTGEVNASVIYSPDGSTMSIIAIIRDITERKRAQDEVFNSRQMLRSVLDNIPQRVFWKDRNLVFAGCNKPFILDCGYEDPGEIVGKTDYEHASAATAELYRADDREVMDSGRAKINYEEPQIRPDGSLAWLMTSKVPMYDRDGQVIGVLGTYADITERKLMEENISQTNAYLENIFDSSPDAIAIVDKHERFIRWNKMAEDLFGYTFEEMKGKSAFDLYADKDEIKKMRKSLGREGSVKKWEMRMVRKDGSIVPFEISTGLLKDSQNETIGSISVARDLSGIKEALSALKVSHERLYQEIAERKQTEEALRESELRLRTILQTVNEGFWLIDNDTATMDLNRRMCAILGRNREEVFGRKIFDFVDSENKAVFNQQIRLRAHGEVGTYEIALSRPDGSNVFCLFNATPLFDGSGNKIGSFAMVTDISERKKAEEALGRSQRQLADIIEFLPDATFVINNEGTVIAWNRAMEEMTGIPQNKMIGKGDFEYSLPFFGSRRPILIDLVFASEEKKTEYYDSVTTVGGSIVAEIYAPETYGGKGAYLWGVATALFDEQGNVTGAIESTRDISERKLAEIALRESEERFSRFFRVSPVGTSITRLSDGRFMDANDAFLGLSGYKLAELVSEDTLKLEIWARPEDRSKMLKTLEEQGRLQDFETRFRRKSGEIMDVLISAEVIEMAGQQYMLALTHDITERKRGEEERKKLEEQLFQAQKIESVGRLAGGVAHDFNNMLGVIIGRAEMALGQDVSPDKLQHHLEEILKAGLRSADLTRQLLAFARKQTAIQKVLDLNDTISGMLNMLQRLIGEDIDLLWAPGPDLWKVKIDPSQVDQILANLAVNARDAISGVGAITLRTQNVVIDGSMGAETPELIPGQYVLLTVSDNGTGMSQEVREKIFEPFFTTKELGKGTGLGLSTVYGIVKQNDGFIYVASEPGKGTTFTIYLQRFEAETAQVPSEEITGKRPTGTETILLVEDDEAILNLGTIILENLGYKVLAAHTPVYALHLVEEHPGDIDLLITDVVMPEMNGRELAEQLKVIRPNLKCLFMSGYTADVIAHRGILDEGVNFIRKPFGSDDFSARVRQVLDHLE